MDTHTMKTMGPNTDVPGKWKKQCETSAVNTSTTGLMQTSSFAKRKMQTVGKSKHHVLNQRVEDPQYDPTEIGAQIPDWVTGVTILDGTEKGTKYSSPTSIHDPFKSEKIREQLIRVYKGHGSPFGTYV